MLYYIFSYESSITTLRSACQSLRLSVASLVSRFACQSLRFEVRKISMIFYSFYIGYFVRFYMCEGLNEKRCKCPKVSKHIQADPIIGYVLFYVRFTFSYESPFGRLSRKFRFFTRLRLLCLGRHIDFFRTSKCGDRRETRRKIVGK